MQKRKPGNAKFYNSSIDLFIKNIGSSYARKGAVFVGDVEGTPYIF